MDLDLVMRTTGAVRAFTDAAVDDATITRILERGRGSRRVEGTASRGGSSW